jgi:hypothetical protein
MTIAQVLQHQQAMIRGGARSTAAGRYQFMSYTLPEYAKKAGFDFNTTLFNAATQDTLADILIREKGYDAYKAGRISREQFLANLSRAWAGLPNPSTGASFYSKDGLNKSNISVASALDRIGQARTGGIFSGPSTGYLAMLHGDEAIIPASDGASAQQYRSMFGGGSKAEKEIADILDMLYEKVETMIDLSERTGQIQTQMRMYSA